MGKAAMNERFPISAINPDGDIVSVLVTTDGRLVTDSMVTPADAVPLAASALRTNSTGALL